VISAEATAERRPIKGVFSRSAPQFVGRPVHDSLLKFGAAGKPR